MASKPSSPGPNPTSAPAAKQARSRKVAAQNQTEQGRAGSAGGVVLEKEASTKAQNTAKPAAKTSTTSAAKDAASDPASATNKPRRKPRKLNQDPAPAPAPAPAPSKQNVTNASKDATSSEAAASELDALKARVRGLEAKVEELYKGNNDPRSARSPRRRGKGRKSSSSKEVPTISSLTSTNARVEEIDDEAEEAEEELVRLEDELDSARRDLELYRPRTRRTISGETEDVEEIPRENIGSTGKSSVAERQVTLSGSYRIPIPANVSVDDVKTIQSGVSAAQNVARNFLEQRRAAAALRAEQNPPSSPSASAFASASASSSTPKAAKRPTPKSTTSSNMQVALDNGGNKQSWGEWIGGYSMAITRAVGKIEHEAAMESQRVNAGVSPSMKKTGAKRPPAKAKLSSEQVHGLMS